MVLVVVGVVLVVDVLVVVGVVDVLKRCENKNMHKYKCA